MLSNTTNSVKRAAVVARNIPKELFEVWMNLSFAEFLSKRVQTMAIGISTVCSATAPPLEAYCVTTKFTATKRSGGGSGPSRPDQIKMMMPARQPLRLQQLILPLVLLFFTTLVTPVAAMDNQIVLATYPIPNNYRVFDPNPPPGVTLQVPSGTIGTFILIAARCLSTMVMNVLGPLMGMSSVLWFIMRNDAAIKPSLSWASVFPHT
jgi:hypothetical protein